MNIAKYADYFHDGSIISVECTDNALSISMESAEIDPEEIHENIEFTKADTIKGMLHIERIKHVRDSDRDLNGCFKMLGDSATILDFDVFEDRIELSLRWKNYPPHKPTSLYSFLEIKAEKIWWENIPNLYDPLDRCVDISKYSSWFHDGSLHEIAYVGNTVLLFLESAEVDPNEVKEIALSRNDRIKGRLCICNIRSITDNGNPVIFLDKKYEHTEIMHLDVQENVISIELIFSGSSMEESFYSVICIEGESIWWENAPDPIALPPTS